MDNSLKNELIIGAASKVHADWCSQELEAFYKRAKDCFSGDVSKALETACYKGENKRNELELNLAGHEAEANAIFDSPENFMKLINSGAIVVKRFTARTLTEEEQKAAGDNYVDGKENILRPFEQLSAKSKEENLEAAIGAANVYTELSQAGVSIQEMLHDDATREQIGIAIHADWLRRNPNHPNESLKVPYKELDEWTQQQDLTVFNALISVVNSNLDRYTVLPVDGAVIPDYEKEEKEILGLGSTR